MSESSTCAPEMALVQSNLKLQSMLLLPCFLSAIKFRNLSALNQMLRQVCTTRCAGIMVSHNNFRHPGVQSSSYESDLNREYQSQGQECEANSLKSLNNYTSEAMASGIPSLGRPYANAILRVPTEFRVLDVNCHLPQIPTNYSVRLTKKKLILNSPARMRHSSIPTLRRSSYPWHQNLDEQNIARTHHSLSNWY